MQKILNTLDALDKHNFERIDQNNSIDTLYNNIFQSVSEKQTNNSNINSSMRFTSKSTAISTNNQSEENKKDYVRKITVNISFIIICQIIYDLILSGCMAR